METLRSTTGDGRNEDVAADQLVTAADGSIKLFGCITYYNVLARPDAASYLKKLEDVIAYVDHGFLIDSIDHITMVFFCFHC
jgi:hypothetical protein